MVDVRIILDDAVIFFFGEIMDLNIGQLLFNTPDNRSCKDYIAYGTKAYDEDFFQTVLFADFQK